MLMIDVYNYLSKNTDFWLDKRNNLGLWEHGGRIFAIFKCLITYLTMKVLNIEVTGR